MRKVRAGWYTEAVGTDVLDSRAVDVVKVDDGCVSWVVAVRDSHQLDLTRKLAFFDYAKNAKRFANDIAKMWQSGKIEYIDPVQYEKFAYASYRFESAPNHVIWG